jgi:hypothetical protein
VAVFWKTVPRHRTQAGNQNSKELVRDSVIESKKRHRDDQRMHAGAV